MMGVVIHEVGHNFFPMIVNWSVNGLGWMKDWTLLWSIWLNKN
jgi:hypothetical protein